jgi:hypothetical protein
MTYDISYVCLSQIYFSLCVLFETSLCSPVRMFDLKMIYSLLDVIVRNICHQHLYSSENAMAKSLKSVQQFSR